MINKLNRFFSLSHKNIIKCLLYQLKVKCTSLYLDRIREAYPDVDRTLGGISKLLALYGVETVPVEVEDKSGFIREAAFPFVAQLPQENVCVVKKEKREIHYFSNGFRCVSDIEDFVKKWTGVALLVEKKKDSSEPHYSRNRIGEILGIIIRLVIGLGCSGIAYVVLSKISWQDATFIASFFLVCIGCGIGGLLLLKQIDSSGSIARKFCTAFTKQDGCKTVLNSPAAKIGGVLSWSEIGFGFFLTTGIWMYVDPYSFPYLLLITGLSLPFSFWSIGYQKWVAKQWCTLCILSQLILWSLFLFNLPELPLQPEFYNIRKGLWIGASYLLVVAMVNRCVHAWEQKKKSENKWKEANRIRMDESVFKLQLSKQKHYPAGEEVSSILFGATRSATLITIVTNPFCSHCAELHKELDELNYFRYTDYCVQYIFNSYSFDLRIIDQLLTFVYFRQEKEVVKRIYREWFTSGNSDPNTFLVKYGRDKEEYALFLQENCKQWMWCKENNIVKTPLVLINGYPLPEGYSLRDLLMLEV